MNAKQRYRRKDMEHFRCFDPKGLQASLGFLPTSKTVVSDADIHGIQQYKKV